MTKAAPKLVRYSSPFGSPAWMTREKAEAHQRDDDRRWLWLQENDALSEEQRQHGPPSWSIPEPPKQRPGRRY